MIVPIDLGLPRRVQLIDFIVGTLGSNKLQFSWDRSQRIALTHGTPSLNQLLKINRAILPLLCRDPRSAWSRFIMALLHRNPESIQRITDEVERNLPSLFKPLDENGPSTHERTSHAILSVLQTIMDSKIVGPVLNGMIWRVLVIDRSRYPLLTSDRPIIMTNGIAKPDGHIVMPISPNQIFVAVNNEEMFRKLDTSLKNGRITEVVNDQVVKQARRFVWGTDDRQLCFVEKRLGQRISCTPWEYATCGG